MASAELFYQAIGELFASLVVTSSGTKVLDTGENQYRAIVPEKVEKKYHKIQAGLRLALTNIDSLDEACTSIDPSGDIPTKAVDISTCPPQGQAYWQVYPQFDSQHLVFLVFNVSQQPKSSPGRFILQGDWVNPEQIEIWRNAEAVRVNAKNWRPRLLSISWQDAPPADGSFWQLEAQLVNGTLEVTKATGPFEHPLRLEALPPFKHNKQQKQLGHSLSTKHKSKVTASIINWEELIPVSGKLELTIKINSLPPVQKANGMCHFKVECDGRIVQIGLKQKQWTKLEIASTTYAEWIAAISGKMGAVTSDGFVLEDSSVQVFERKSKAKTQVEQVLPENGNRVAEKEQDGATAGETTQTKPETQKPQTESVAPGKSITSADEKLASKEKSSKSEPQPKKIGKFNVQIR